MVTPLGNCSLAPGPRAAFLSLGGAYLISENCMLQQKLYSFSLIFPFPLYFSSMEQMGFSLGSLFTALAAAECPGCSFLLSPKPQV